MVPETVLVASESLYCFSIIHQEHLCRILNKCIFVIHDCTIMVLAMAQPNAPPRLPPIPYLCKDSYVLHR